MKDILKVTILASVILFAGCDLNDNPDKPKYVIPNVGERVEIPVQTETIINVPIKLRYDLKKVQTFKDDDAYGNVRNIYILKDSETGIEYIGVSGIGITEMGKHSSGKTTVRDER